MSNYKNLTALITGASSGLGKEFAVVLAKRGVDLVLTARDEGRLLKLKNELENQYSVSVTIIQKDLALHNAGFELFKECESLGLQIDVLINNAGFAVRTDRELDNPHEVERMLQLNAVAVTNLSNLFGRAMSDRGGGYILNVASVAAFFPLPYAMTYSSTKTFVYEFTRNFRYDYRRRGVEVTTLIPGGTRTNFFKNNLIPIHPLHEKSLLSAQTAAEKAVKSLFKRRKQLIPGLLPKLSVFFGRMIPRPLIYRIMRKRWARIAGLKNEKIRTACPIAKTALVTGASSGIGRAVAIILAERGIDLVVASRRVNKLNELKSELESAFNIQVAVIQMDLSEPGAAFKLYSRCGELGKQIDVLINNAGYGVKTEEERQFPEKTDRMLQLMMVNSTLLSHLFIKDMRQRKGGFVMNVGSSSAFFPVGMMRSYSPTKAYIYSYTRSLNMELRKDNIRATCLAPGAVRTEFMDSGGLHVPNRFEWIGSLLFCSPRRVGKAGLRAMKSGRKLSLPGVITKLFVGLAYLFPHRWVYSMFNLVEIIRSKAEKKENDKV